MLPAHARTVVARPPRRRRLAALVAAALATALLVGLLPAPVAASTETDMATSIRGWINDGRTAAGLVPYRAWPSLDLLATQRAERMAASHTLSHEAAGGDVGLALDAAQLPWYGWGETIAMSGYPFGTEAARNVYSMWMASPPHRAILRSGTFNYVGIGVARAPDGTSWVSAVVTESPDHTAPVASTRSLTRSGTSVTYRWLGVDRRLQTHTAGIATFAVQYRVDAGAWRVLRTATTATGLTLAGRAHRHTYSFRVQTKDRRGNLSPWSAAVRIWVP